MGIEYVTISVGGGSYTAFKLVEVKAAFNEASRSFRIVLAAELGASATNALLNAGKPIKIMSNGDLMLDGFVDKKNPQIDANQAQIVVTGRSKSADLVDSSAKKEGGNFKDKDPLEIGNAVAEGISAKFTTDQQLKKIKQYQINPGESCFRLVEKMARKQGMTICGQADGNAKITKAGKERHSGGIVEGQNMKSGSSSHDMSNRHSEIIVRGQRPFGHKKEDYLEIEAKAKDGKVGRQRPLLIYMDEDTDKEGAKDRAKNRKDRAAGHSLTAEVEVQGFRDEGGKLWEPGHLVWMESPFLDIAQDMLIESVTWTQSEAGSVSNLTLKDPRAYGGEGGKGNQSGEGFGPGMDDSEAE